MSEDNSKEADTKKTPAKKTVTRSKATTAKPAAKKAAAKKAPAKKVTTTSKSAATKTTKPRAKTAAPKSVKTKPVEEKAENNPKRHTAGTEENEPPKEDTGFDAENTNEADSKPDTAQMIDDLKGRDWPQIIQRALLMFFFGVLGSFALYLSFVMAVAQVGFSIFVGQPNKALTRVMRQCAFYIRDVLDYLSFASDECPFPFGRDLPEVD